MSRTIALRLVRRAFVLLAAVAIGLVGSITVPHTAHAATKKSVAISIKRSHYTVSAGRATSVFGTVKYSNGKRASKLRLTLQTRTNGTSKWVNRATVKTNSKGNYRFTRRITTNTQFRVVVKGTSKVKAKVSPARLINARQTVRITSVSKRSLDPGTKFTVRGTTSVGLRGRTLYVQAYDAGEKRWFGLASGKVTKNGAFAITSKLTTAGANQRIRVYHRGTKALKAVSTSAGKVNVWKWYYLSDLDTVASSSRTTGPFTVNGTQYLNSVAMETRNWWRDVGDVSYAEYSLSRKCNALRATVGIADDAASTEVRYQSAVKGDDQQLWSAQTVFGTSTPVSIDIRGVLRLRLQAVVLDRRDSKDVFGNARVHCLFDQ